jgi:hypothetical protein
MTPRNQKRAAMLNRLSQVYNVRRIMKEENLSARELADRALAIEAALREVFGGPAHFTGNNRVFANGAIGSEVRCKKCRRTFWVTAMPYALCPDCYPY